MAKTFTSKLTVDLQNSSAHSQKQFIQIWIQNLNHCIHYILSQLVWSHWSARRWSCWCSPPNKLPRKKCSASHNKEWLWTWHHSQLQTGKHKMLSLLFPTITIMMNLVRLLNMFPTSCFCVRNDRILFILFYSLFALSM